MDVFKIMFASVCLVFTAFLLPFSACYFYRINVLNCVGIWSLEVLRVGKLISDSLLRTFGKICRMLPWLSPSLLPSFDLPSSLISHHSVLFIVSSSFCLCYITWCLRMPAAVRAEPDSWRIDGALLQSGYHRNIEEKGWGEGFFVLPSSVVTVGRVGLTKKDEK